MGTSELLLAFPSDTGLADLFDVCLEFLAKGMPCNRFRMPDAHCKIQEDLVVDPSDFRSLLRDVLLRMR